MNVMFFDRETCVYAMGTATAAGFLQKRPVAAIAESTGAEPHAQTK